MNTHVDITSAPIVAMHLDPDYQFDMAARDEGRKAAIETYISDWCAGNIFYDDGEVYAQPLQALIDNEPELLLQLMADYRKGDAAELESSAGDLARAMIKYVKEQAEKVML